MFVTEVVEESADSEFGREIEAEGGGGWRRKCERERMGCSSGCGSVEEQTDKMMKAMGGTTGCQNECLSVSVPASSRAWQWQWHQVLLAIQK